MFAKGISIKELQLWYGDFHAVKGVSMEIDPKAVTAFIGPSGCGKSTVLRCLNRMNDLIENVRIEGEVNIDRQNIYAPNVDVYALRKKVGMVFQKPSPFPKTIFENVAYGLRVNGMRNKTEIADIVEKSLKGAALWNEVKDKLKQSALGLSGGQQQRLCIARAIAPNPEVVLMDEPTSALDPISTVQVEELMADLKKHYTIVIVTHNMQQAQRIADKTAFFFLGHLIEYTDTHSLFNNPKEEKTQKYISGDFS
ncbi:MAG: phosphate ABC transporter ATP-binding protein PstB [Saprospiraceae bacterium]|nr:phosphate ABC transporter ATP-binding protein PstB [Saprospiraceae bacterium]